LDKRNSALDEAKSYFKRDRIVIDTFERGFLTFGCGDNTIRFCSAPSISLDEMEEALIIFEASIAEAEKGGFG